jgi:cytidylate kinase
MSRGFRGLHGLSTDSLIRTIAKATAMPRRDHPEGGEVERAVPFVTISRQAGAGGRTLAEALVDRLARLEALLPGGPPEPPWTIWDRELIEKVASDLHISAPLIDRLEDRAQSWLSELFSGMSSSSTADAAAEIRVYHRVAETMRSLAQGGRVILVGRAGVFITRSLPGGIHVRLVAPPERRVQNMMEREGLTRDAAQRRVAEIDRNRAAFYRRYWPRESLESDRFTVTLNTAELSERQMVECLLPLIGPAERAS